MKEFVPEVPDFCYDIPSVPMQQFNALLEWEEPPLTTLLANEVERPWLYAALYAAQLDRTRGFNRPEERLRLRFHRDEARNVLRRVPFTVPPKQELMEPTDPDGFRHEVYASPSPLGKVVYWERALRDVQGRDGYIPGDPEMPECDVFQLHTLLDVLHPRYEKDSVRPDSRNGRLRTRFDSSLLERTPKRQDHQRVRYALMAYVEREYEQKEWVSTGHWHSNYHIAAEALLLKRMGWHDFEDRKDTIDEQREKRFMYIADRAITANLDMLPKEVGQLRQLCIYRRAQRERQR